MFGRSSTPEEIARFFNELKAHCAARNAIEFDHIVEDYDAFTFPWRICIGNEELSFTDHYGAEMSRLVADGKLILVRKYEEHELRIGEFYRETYRLLQFPNSLAP